MRIAPELGNRTEGPLPSRDPFAEIVVSALRMVFGDDLGDEYAVELWDGTRIGPAESAARFTLRVNDPGAMRFALRPPLEVNTGRAFADGLLDCEGDLEGAFDLLYNRMRALPLSAAMKIQPLLNRLPKTRAPIFREARLRGKVHSRERDRAAISFHYDHAVEFYRTFLGTPLVYSCAYFDDETMTLEQAQTAKMDYILRKLRLQSGERLLDIGCGWGALAIHAAQTCGARVLGVTLSQKQYEEAQREVESAGIGHLVKVEMRDYRELVGESFDKIASVGMFEHVGRSKLPEYFSTAFALLRPGGLFLNHGIADQDPRARASKIGGFVERFVFPDGELLSIGDALQIAQHAGWEVRDVENLREHYALTLRAWVRNLERNHAAAVNAVGEQTYRIWRLYMAGSAQGFRVGRIGVFQALLAKRHSNGVADVPRTRRDLYA